MTFVAFACILPSAMASLAPHNDHLAPGKTALPTTGKDRSLDLDKPDPVPSAPATEDKSEKQNLVLTDDTEVTLDGVRCKFVDVPGDAAVVSLAVAADKKTILKIQFQSKK